MYKRQTLDRFADVMIQIAEEAHNDPDVLHTAPHKTPYGRLDEVKAARELVLCCRVDAGSQAEPLEDQEAEPA